LPEGLDNFFAYFVVGNTCRRPQRNVYIFRAYTVSLPEPDNSLFDNTCQRPTPTGMDGGKSSRPGTADQHRLAVSRVNCCPPGGIVPNPSIPFPRLRSGNGIQKLYGIAMNLPECV